MLAYVLPVQIKNLLHEKFILQLYDHVSNHCNEEWHSKFSMYVEDLKTASQPLDGDCAALGENMESAAMRRMNNQEKLK